jgi:hypothetical protein
MELLYRVGLQISGLLAFFGGALPVTQRLSQANPPSGRLDESPGTCHAILLSLKALLPAGRFRQNFNLGSGPVKVRYFIFETKPSQWGCYCWKGWGHWPLNLLLPSRLLLSSFLHLYIHLWLQLPMETLWLRDPELLRLFSFKSPVLPILKADLQATSRLYHLSSLPVKATWFGFKIVPLAVRAWPPTLWLFLPSCTSFNFYESKPHLKSKPLLIHESLIAIPSHLIGQQSQDNLSWNCPCFQHSTIPLQYLSVDQETVSQDGSFPKLWIWGTKSCLFLSVANYFLIS